MSNVIIGGGISGIFSAHLMQKYFPGKETIIVEKSAQLGGLLKSVEYSKYGKFDYGVHTFYETGIPEIDNFFIQNIPSSGWYFQDGYERDLGGCIWNKQINYNSPYIDLRHIAPHRLETYRKELLRSLRTRRPSQTRDAHSFFRERFGASLASDHLDDFIEKRQHISAKKVHRLSAQIQQLARVVMYDLDDLFSEETPEHLYQVSAFPDQTNYPEQFMQKKRTFYPNEIGVDSAISAYANSVKNDGVKILTNTQICDLTITKNRINSITITSNDGKTKTISTDQVICTIPQIYLSNLLFPNDLPVKFDPPKHTKILNLVTNEKPNSKKLSWILSHGHEFIHRISFPNNYSENINIGDYKVCVECVFNNTISEQNLKTDVIQFLLDCGLLSDESKILFTDVVNAPGGFPTLSLQNINTIEAFNNRVSDRELENLVNIGILSDEDMFFQFDLIKNGYEKIKKLHSFSV